KVRLSPRRQQAPILQLRNSRVRCRILETSYLSDLLEIPGSILLHCVNDLHVHFVELRHDLVYPLEILLWRRESQISKSAQPLIFSSFPSTSSHHQFQKGPE